MGLSNSKPATKFYYDFVKNEVPSLEGKTIAVTGTTTGTGYIFAKTTIEKGATNLLLLNRPSERSTQSEKELKEYAESIVQGDSSKTVTHIETIPCDLQDFASVREAASMIKAKYESLDVLCNNAGIMAVQDRATKDGYDVQMQTNHLSHFLLTKELYPLLKKAKELRGEARVVHHSSFVRLSALPLQRKYYEKNGGNLGGNLGGNAVGWTFSGPIWERYYQSKLANTVCTTALAQRFPTGIKATVAAPGYATTNLHVTSEGMGGKMWTRTLLAHSAEDGTTPLLAAAYLPCETGAFWQPANRSNMVGPAKQMELEPLSKDPEEVKLLWECSEAACGKFEIN